MLHSFVSRNIHYSLCKRNCEICDGITFRGYHCFTGGIVKSCLEDNRKKKEEELITARQNALAEMEQRAL